MMEIKERGSPMHRLREIIIIFLLISYEQFGWRRIIVDLLKDDAF